MPELDQFTVTVTVSRVESYQTVSMTASQVARYLPGEDPGTIRTQIEADLFKELRRGTKQAMSHIMQDVPDSMKAGGSSASTGTQAQGQQGADLSTAKDECCRKCGAPVKVIYGGGNKPDIWQPDGSQMHYKVCQARPQNQGGGGGYRR